MEEASAASISATLMIAIAMLNDDVYVYVYDGIDGDKRKNSKRQSSWYREKAREVVAGYVI